MTQERMHPEDLKALVAGMMLATCGDSFTNSDMLAAIDGAETLLVELSPTTPTPESNADYRVRLEMERADKAEADLKTARENLKKADDRWANEQEVSARHLAKTIILDARVKKLEEAIRFHESRRIGGPSRVDMELWDMVH